jgi:hypothetical protein
MRKLRHMLWQLPALVGAGALFASGARATVSDAASDEFGAANAGRYRAGEVLVKLENHNIYFSQDAGQTFQELAPTATPEATRLKRLLEQGDRSGGHGAVKVRPTVVADGAGGLQWARPRPAPTGSVNGSQQVAVPATPVAADKDASAVRPSGSEQTKPK